MAAPQRPVRRRLRVALALLAALALLLAVVLTVRSVRTARRERADRALAQQHEQQFVDTLTPDENADRGQYRARLALARMALDDGRLDEAQRMLERCPESQRALEWGLLDLVARQATGDGSPPFADLATGGPSVNDLAVARDGRRLAAAGDDGRVRLYDLQTGALLHTLAGHSSPVLGVSFAPDGLRLASCSGLVEDEGDASVRLWDTASGEQLALLTGHTSAVCGVAFSPDGRRLASVSGAAMSRADDTLRLWDAASGECLAVLTGHEGLLGCVEFSPDGRLVATGSVDKTIRLWEAEGGRLVATLAGHASAVLCLAFSPNGAQLASGSGDPLGLGERVVRLWDVASGTPLTVLTGHRSAIFALAWSPDGRRLASGSGNLPIPLVERDPGDTSIRLWDAADGGLLLTLPSPGVPGLEAPIWELVFTPDGRRLVSADNDGVVRVWFSRAEDAIPLVSR